jgi:endonuclease YncB( thermonuclease family)
MKSYEITHQKKEKEFYMSLNLCQYLKRFQSSSCINCKIFIVIAVIISGCSESFDNLQARIIDSQTPPSSEQLPSSKDINSPQYYELKSKSVYDGNTFKVINPITQEETKITLACINAPEKKQKLGIASRDYLQSLLNQNPTKLIITQKEKDRYGRTIAEIFIPTGKGDEEIPVNAMMLRSGYAYYYAEHSKNCVKNAFTYENLELEAQQSRVGVWKNSSSIKPSDFRKITREK